MAETRVLPYWKLRGKRNSIMSSQHQRKITQSLDCVRAATEEMDFKFDLVLTKVNRKNILNAIIGKLLSMGGTTWVSESTF